MFETVSICILINYIFYFKATAMDIAVKVQLYLVITLCVLDYYIVVFESFYFIVFYTDMLHAAINIILIANCTNKRVLVTEQSSMINKSD